MSGDGRLDAFADELLAACDGVRQAPLLTTRGAPFTLDDAFAVADRLRMRRIARGERPVGWKIGFTNRGIWERYGVHAPIWGPVWDSTLTLLDGTQAETPLGALCLPRLEPEIVFGLARTPEPGMDEAALAGCIAWVAHGFEIVHSHCGGWRFAAPDCLADFALHGRLYVGPRVPVARFADLGAELAALQVELHDANGLVERGDASVVLDGPLNALRLWVDAMARQQPRWTIAPGDCVTTGTMTDAWPLAPGQRWQTRLSDPRLAGLTLRTRA
jgi:2-oxo-3-hexenedioate decarboxylase